jgi:hypothetical protein
LINTILLLLITLPFTSAAQDSVVRKDFLPQHVKFQFAGGIGLISVGFGYESKNKKVEGDFYYGYVPEKRGGVEIHTVSSKPSWFPLKKVRYKGVGVRPLSLGTWVNYTFGKQYFLFSPENYPYNYYKFPTAMHMGAFIGGQVEVSKSKRKKLSFYYELGTTDVDVVSYATNVNAIQFSQIFNLGLGVKTSF